MTNVRLDISGEAEAIKALQAFPNFLEKAINDGVMASALAIQNEARRSIMKGPKTGRIYKRGSVRHRASAPGEAPANDTGALVQSIYAVTGPENLAASVGIDMKYALFLEYGTRNMAARPFMAPAIMKMQKHNENVINGYIQYALNTITGKNAPEPAPETAPEVEPESAPTIFPRVRNAVANAGRAIRRFLRF